MLTQKKRIDLLRSGFKCGQRNRFILISHKCSKRHCGLSPALPRVDRGKTALQENASIAPAGYFADQPEDFGPQNPLDSAIGLNHAFPPACDPHLPFLAACKQISILVPTANHFCPLFRVVGSSAFPYVAYECTPSVKLHSSVHVETRPTPRLPLGGIASICPSEFLA